MEELIEGLSFLLTLGVIIKVPDKETAMRFYRKGQEIGEFPVKYKLNDFILQCNPSNDDVVNPKLITMIGSPIVIMEDCFLTYTNKDLMPNNFNYKKSYSDDLIKYAQLIMLGKIPQRKEEGKLTIIYGEGVLSSNLADLHTFKSFSSPKQNTLSNYSL